MILISAAFSDFITYDENGFFSVIIGHTGWLGLFFYSQQIINKNQFLQMLFVGIGIFIVCQIEQKIFYKKLSNASIFTSMLPFGYILYFRLLIFLFFKDYPESIRSEKRPAIIYASKCGRVNHERSYLGHKPTMKERVFSLLLFIGFIWLIIGITIVFRT
jgi:hypothetical protein